MAPLTRFQLRQLQRELRDLDDRTRYLLVSVFTRKFALYYDVSRDVYAMNDASAGTLFKRRGAAEVIQRLLGGGVQIVRCRVNRRDRLVKSSLPRLRPSLGQRHGRKKVRRRA